MDSAGIHAIWTVVALITFVGIVIWAWSARRRADFDAASRLPLEDDAPHTNADRSPTHE